MILDIAALIIFPLALAYAAGSDLVTMTVPNRLQLILAAAFAVAALAVGMDGAGWLRHIGGGLLMLTLGFGCFARGWIGGGDAKLAAVIGLWFGPSQALLECMFLTAIYGGLLTLLLLLARSRPLPTLLARQGWIARLHDSKSGVPYGVALAAAALMVYPKTFWVAAALGG